MSLISGSIICQLIFAIGRVFAQAWQGSIPMRVYRALAAFFRPAAETWKRWWHGSAVVRFFFEKEGALPRAWPKSLTCRALTLLLNLPVALLHWVYVKLKGWFEGSFFASLAFGLGQQVPIAIGWAMLLFMNIDYWKWSNGYSFLGFVLIALLFLAGGMRARSLRLDLAGVGLYPAAFFLAVCLSWPLSCHPELSGRYLTYHITCALCVLLTVSAVEREEQLERLAAFGCLGMSGAAICGIYQRFAGIAVMGVFVDQSLNPDVPGRIFSFYVNPNAFAEMLVMLLPVAVGLLFGAEKKINRVIGLLSTGLGGAALIMTYCRASWAGIAVSALVFLFFWKPKWIPVCLVGAVAMLPFLPAGIYQRLVSSFNPRDTSISSRMPLLQASARMIKAHPILGAGLGADAVRQVSNDLHAYTASYARFTHSHNLFLQIWLEHGLLGITTFVAGSWHMLKQAAGAYRSTRAGKSTRFIALGSASALAGSLMSGMGDYLFTYPRVMLIFWFSVALLLSGARLARRGTAPARVRG